MVFTPMRSGIVILNIFAFVWLAGAIGALDLPLWLTVLPIALSIGIGWWCLARVGDVPQLPPGVARDIGRIVGLWSTIEGVLIAIAVIVLVRLGQPELIPPVIAVIVGLHFIPLAHALGVPLYYWTAAGLIVVGLGALVVPGSTLAIAGIGAAVVLYVTSLVLPGSAGTAPT